MSNGRALVSGGAGFLGSHVVDRLLNDEWSVKIVDNFSSGARRNILRSEKRLEILVGDLKEEKVADVGVKGIDVVFHFAANPEVRLSTTHPSVHFQENIVATFNLIEAARQNGVRTFVFASSSSVYGETGRDQVAESYPMAPVSVYGATKCACENILHSYSRLYGIDVLILRYANILGPRLTHGIVYDFVSKLKRNPRKLTILGDGMQTRSYLWGSDAVDATLRALRECQGSFGVYNVGNKDCLTAKEVAAIVVEAMGLRGVRYMYKPALGGLGWKGDVRRIVLDIAKIERLGWKPLKTSKHAVTETVKTLLSFGCE